MLAGTLQQVRGENRGVVEIGARFCVVAVVWYYLFYQNLVDAYRLRLKPIEKLGPVIHGFQPYLNIRQAQYLDQHGLAATFQWFDSQAWYPLGIDVGQTIRPGLSLTTVFALWFQRNVLYLEVSLQQTAAYLPIVAGLCSSVFVGFLTRECTRSWPAAGVAGSLMGILPGNMLYTMGGKYDSVALLSASSTLSIYLWAKAIQNDPAVPQSPKKSLLYGTLSGSALAFTAACWSGHTLFFVLVTIHTLLLCLLGRYSRNICCAYCSFFSTSVLLSVMIPVVRLDPLTLKAYAPGALLFVLLLLLECSGRKGSFGMGSLIVTLWVGLVAVMFEGMLGPVNDLPESLLTAITQDLHPHLLLGGPSSHYYRKFMAGYWTLPPNVQVLFDHFSLCTWIISPGILILLAKLKNNAAVLALVYVAVVSLFLIRRSSIVVLATPPVALLCGAAIGLGLVEQVSLRAIYYFLSNRKKTLVKVLFHVGLLFLGQILGSQVAFNSNQVIVACETFAEKAAESAIVFKLGGREDEKEVIIDDYRATYFWVMQNTPPDSRILAWEDYGYHINAMSNRTTLLDSRLRSDDAAREHRATVALALVSDEKASAKIVKHLADYIITWVNGNGEDLAKLGVIASVANDTYPFVCGADAKCMKYHVPEERSRVISPWIKSSLVYKLARFRSKGNEDIFLSHYDHMYTSTNGKVRVFKVKKPSKKSQKWAKKQRNCSGYSCPGAHPPSLRKHLKKLRKSYLQT